MKTLRIFIAHPSDLLTNHRPYGDGLIAFEFLRRLAERDHEIHVAADECDIRGPIPPRMVIHPIPADRSLPEFARRLLFMVRMRSLFQRLDRVQPFDVVQQMNPVSAGLSLALLGIPRPLVLGPYPPRWPEDADGPVASNLKHSVKTFAKVMISRAQQSQAAALITTSPAAMNRIFSERAKKGRIFTTPLAVDSGMFQPRTTVPANQSILFMANLNVRKGIFTLLEAFELLAKKNRRVTLTVAGHGPLAERVKEQVSGSAAQDRIRMIGAVSRPDVSGLMHEHSLYCLPSYGEPASVAILEAMACGLPVVATDAGGSPYLVSHEGGRLARPRDAQGLANALSEVLDSVELQRSMGVFNRLRIEREFDWDAVIDRLEGIFRKVLPQTPAVSGPVQGNFQPEHGVERSR